MTTATTEAALAGIAPQAYDLRAEITVNNVPEIRPATTRLGKTGPWMPAFVRIALGLAFAMAIAGCSHKQAADDDAKDGHIVRVDKETGVVTVLDDSKIVKVRTPEEQAAEDSEREQLAKPKTMRSVKLPTSAAAAAMLSIFWSNDQLHYTFSISPDSPQVEAARANGAASFDILLRGPDGGLIKQVSIPASSLQPSKAGNSAGVLREGTEPCSTDDYRRITTWDLTWRGLNPQ